MKRRIVVVAVAAALVAGAVAMIFRPAFGYHATLVLPAASNLVAHTPIQIDGRDAGTIEEVWTEEGRAMVRVSVDSGYAPLHDGTNARVRWKAVLSERILELLPGPVTNPALPDDALIVGSVAPVEFDQVLATLDPATRQKLTSLIGRLDETLKGHEPDLNATLRTAGPAIDAVGGVLDGIGNDGPAISDLVGRMNSLTSAAVERRTDVSGAIEHLARAADEISRRRAEMRESLRELPSTLTEVDRTMRRVPAATDATVPLLNDLAPGVSRLPSVAGRLDSVMSDLEPTLKDLRPTVDAARDALRETPDLLDGTHDVFPSLARAIDSTRDAASFLRPYTPEIIGLFSNWASFAGNYDSNGTYARVFEPQSASSFSPNVPGVLPPGLWIDRTPLPGSLEGQPWKDANGSGPR
jgi:phospholipid/cholesterol/gamma-HCH transport system substrate-binding protein